MKERETVVCDRKKEIKRWRETERERGIERWREIERERETIERKVDRDI